MRKIVKIFTFIILAFLLSSCNLSINFDNTDKPLNLEKYETQTSYEEKITKSIEINEASSVVVLSDTSNFSSGIIYKKEKANNYESYYYVITTANVIKDSQTLRIHNITQNKKYLVRDYIINELYGIALLRFKTVDDLKVLSFENNTNPVLGQTAVIIGTPHQKDNYLNYITEGIVSLISGDTFSVDASSSYGHGGAGIYSLDGNILGIVLSKQSNIVENEYTFIAEGITNAISATLIKNVIDQYKDTDFDVAKNTNYVLNKAYNEPIKISEYKTTVDHEKSLIEAISNVNKGLVTIKFGESIYRTGVIYKKTQNDKNIYYVLASTINIEDIEIINAKIILNDQTNLNYKDYLYYKNYGLVLYRFETELNLEIVDMGDIDKTYQTIQGQTIFSVGSYLDSETLYYVSKGILGKTSTGTNEIQFSHSIKTNPQTMSAPIFNLNGEWIGFNYMKGEIGLRLEDNSEGVSFAYNMNIIKSILNNTLDSEFSDLKFAVNISTNTFDRIQNLIPYISPSEHEKKVISIIENVYDATLAIQASTATTSSHGSGVIYKKETRAEGGFYYYIATNYHVIGSKNESQDVADNLTIYLGPEYGTLEVLAYKFNKQQDVASLIIASELDLPVIEIKDNRELIRGQTIISIGSPYDYSVMFNYATTGVVSLKEVSYENMQNLTYMQDSSINPGNSGGPSFNLNGELIGLNVAKIKFTYINSQAIPTLGLGYTLNMHTISKVLKDSTSYFQLEVKPRIGITITDIINYNVMPGVDPILDESIEGVVVIQTDINRGAYNKLFARDVITHINGIRVANQEILSTIVGSLNLSFGDKLNVKVLREINGVFVEVETEVVIEWKA